MSLYVRLLEPLMYASQILTRVHRPSSNSDEMPLEVLNLRGISDMRTFCSRSPQLTDLSHTKYTNPKIWLAANRAPKSNF